MRKPLALGIALIAALCLFLSLRDDESSVSRPACAPAAVPRAETPAGTDEAWMASVREVIAEDQRQARGCADGSVVLNAVPGRLAFRTEAACFEASGGEWSIAWGWAGVEGVTSSPTVLGTEGAVVRADRGLVQESFENRSDGVEHTIRVLERPARDGLRVRIPVTAGLRASSNAGTPEIVLADEKGTERLAYRGILAWGADGRRMAASLGCEEGAIRIEVDDAGAAYPVTIDPLISPASWIVDPTDQAANFGWSVSSAGDVNGDGFSDVIVGALWWDGEATDEGRAYLFLGSGTGLGVTPAWTADPTNQGGGRFGYSVSSAGDVNGDGFADVAVGAPQMTGEFTNEGRVYVYHGSPTGLPASADWTADSADQGNAWFGRSIACAGDVNGDGFGDLIVGADYWDGAQVNEGRAFLFYGSASGVGATPVWFADPTDVDNARYGVAVSSAGDVNGDGFSDVVIGAQGFDNQADNEGAAFVYYGSAGGLPASPGWQTDPTDQLNAEYANSVASGGDVNGDGFSDVVIGAWGFDAEANYEGRAYLFLGSATGLATTAAWAVDPTDTGLAEFGQSVACAGDVNGDGFSDVIVGAQTWWDGVSFASEGRAYLFLGTSAGLQTTAAWIADPNDQTGARFGYSVSGSGDVNGDGFSDVIVGSMGWDGEAANEGRAHLFLGSSRGLSPAPSWNTDPTDQLNGQFGNTVASAGDVNRDGFDDVIVGAQLFDAEQSNEGRAYLFLGSASGPSGTAAWTADPTDQADAEFGGCVAGAGDVNGDGYADILVGAFLFDAEAIDEGRAYLYLGGPGGPSLQPDWTIDPTDQLNAEFGYSLAGAGDVNGDGLADIAVGAWLWDSGSANEGRVFVFHGSLAGLAGAADWVSDPTDQAGARFGYSVAGAGDVNGDGFSDLVVGANLWNGAQTDEGRAFAFHGSATGLGAAPAWTADPTDQNTAEFGASVAGAGDVNRDGYSDVIIGAPLFDAEQVDEGRAYLYAGSAAGLAGAALTTLDPTDQLTARFGWSVAGAGDVNADGFADVLVGADGYDAEQVDEGRAYVYHGGLLGLPGTPSWTADPTDQANAQFGYSAAGAGDVNADGFADVVIGAFKWNGEATDEGRAFAVLGVGDTGIPPRGPSLQQFRADGTTSIDLGGIGGATIVLRGSLINNGPIGGRLRLQAEVKPIGTPFDGTGLSTGSAAASGSIGEVSVSGLTTGARHWRARVAYPGAGSSRWHAFGANDEGDADLRVEATPPTVPSLTSPADLVVTGDTTPALDWADSTDAGAGVLDYDVEVDESAAFTAPVAWSATVIPSDATAAVLAEGTWFWRARASDGVGNVSAWSGSRSFTIDTTPPTVPAGVVLSPNGGGYVKGGATLGISWDSSAIADPNLAALPIVLEYTVDGLNWILIATGEANDGAYDWTVPLVNSALVRVRVSADDSAGNRAGDISDAAFIVDSTDADEVVAGLGSGGGRGWLQTFTNLPVGLANTGWQQVPWVPYANANGETRPACGDVDGDGRDELVIGFGSYPASGGWVVIRDDAVAEYAVLRWIRVPWTAYNAADGQTRPACADFDGDGRAEIAVGLGPYPTQGGRCALFEDASAGNAFWRWVDVPWADYNAANGETRPAGGDLDGDGRAELVVGLGTYTAAGGRVLVLDDGPSGFAFVRWVQFAWGAYNAANGETWPAVGNLDVDAREEIVLGLGTYTPAGGWFRAYDDTLAGNVAVGWGRVNWTDYNAADGEVRPACGDLDGDGRAEVLLGLARYPAVGGWINVHRDLTGNLASLRWVRENWSTYNAANGETWPAAGDVR